MYTVSAFTVIASAQCNKVQLLVNDTEFTADILYMPVDSSIVVERECANGERKSDWLYTSKILLQYVLESFCYHICWWETIYL